MILFTGGAGFIGSSFVLDWLAAANEPPGKPLPIYGDGMQSRDWLSAKDRTSAVRRVLDAGTPGETFETGIRKTVRWYLDHQDWVANVASGGYRDWLDTHYGAAST
jgi:dTDP-D-glucose 4,6-dehydratase